MKQIINKEQLDQLSDSQYDKYLDWMIKHDYNQGFGRDHIVPMNIGQMIEFLDENTEYEFHIFRRMVDWKIIYEELPYGKVLGEELIDSLWEATKEKLDEKSIKKGKNVKSN